MSVGERKEKGFMERGCRAVALRAKHAAALRAAIESKEGQKSKTPADNFVSGLFVYPGRRYLILLFFSSSSSFSHEVRKSPANAWISFWTKEKGEEHFVFAV